MRIICFLFFTIVLFGTSKTIVADLDDDKYDAVIDTKVVEYEENEETEPERPIRKERIKGIKNFVGTNLFGETGCRKKCFSVEDVALLAARRDFESLIPKDLPNCLLDDELVSILMQYFYGANQVIDKMASGHSKMFTQKAFYDTLGGYMKYYMIPITRYSYYAGLVKLRTVQNVLDIYTQCKYSLNTNGNGWRAPLADFSDVDLQIEPLRIVIRNKEEDVSCIQLDLVDDRMGEEEDMIVALPRLDPEEKGILGNVWIPFKRKRSFNLQSCMSAFILLRYFELTTRCYTFQGICQDTFNKRFKEWILENLEIHFGDDVLYPGLGAILRIVETLRRKNKGSIIIIPKTKRQKTPNSQNSQCTDTELRKPLKNWPGDLMRIKDPDVVADYIVEENLHLHRLQKRRMRYIYIGIAVTIVFLIIAFLLICFALASRWRKKKKDIEDAKRKAEEEEKSWFCCRKSRKDDEQKKKKTVVINQCDKSKPATTKSESKSKSKSESKSPKKSKSSKRPSNEGSSSPELPMCLALCSKGACPAIIETTSMDSDSGKDKKKKQKAKTPSPAKSPKNKSKTTKTKIVNEKKGAKKENSSSKCGIFKRKRNE